MYLILPLLGTLGVHMPSVFNVSYITLARNPSPHPSGPSAMSVAPPVTPTTTLSDSAVGFCCWILLDELTVTQIATPEPALRRLGLCCDVTTARPGPP